MLMLGSTCFGHHYAHHQELTTKALNFQPAATREPDGLCGGNQRFRRDAPDDGHNDVRNMLSLT